MLWLNVCLTVKPQWASGDASVCECVQAGIAQSPCRHSSQLLTWKRRDCVCIWLCLCISVSMSIGGAWIPWQIQDFSTGWDPKNTPGQQNQLKANPSRGPRWHLMRGMCGYSPVCKWCFWHPKMRPHGLLCCRQPLSTWHMHMTQCILCKFVRFSIFTCDSRTGGTGQLFLYGLYFPACTCAAPGSIHPIGVQNASNLKLDRRL